MHYLIEIGLKTVARNEVGHFGIYNDLASWLIRVVNFARAGVDGVEKLQLHAVQFKFRNIQDKLFFDEVMPALKARHTGGFFIASRAPVSTIGK